MGDGGVLDRLPVIPPTLDDVLERVLLVPLTFDDEPKVVLLFPLPLAVLIMLLLVPLRLEDVPEVASLRLEKMSKNPKTAQRKTTTSDKR